MSIAQAYNSLRHALAREAKEERMAGKPAYGAPSERDFWIADIQINSMSHTTLLLSLEHHEEP